MNSITTLLVKLSQMQDTNMGKCPFVLDFPFFTKVNNFYDYNGYYHIS